MHGKLAAALIFQLLPAAISSPQISAQPGYTVIPCLDVLAVNSTSVFIAKVVNLCGAVPCEGQNNVIVNIEGFLKGGNHTGEAEEHINNVSTSSLLDWKDHGDTLLMFSGTDDQPAYAAQNVEKVFDLSDPNLKALTENMQVLTGARTRLYGRLKMRLRGGPE